MEKFTKHTGKCAPLFEQNIDTDQIVPKKFLLSVSRTGYDKALFYDWRFDKNGNPIKDFVLNDPKFNGASILITGANFGCGSSREHAPWALQQYGFRAIIAPSFADIFYNNCFKTDVLPVILGEEKINEITENIVQTRDYSLTVDLEEKAVFDNEEFVARFEVSNFRRHCLLNGFDDIDLTLLKTDKIKSYEETRLDFLDKSAL